jgi:hypothetical protein
MRSAGTVARRGLHMAFLLQHLDILINFHQTWNFNPSPFLYIERTTSVPCLLLRDPEPAYFVLAPVRLLLTPPSPSLPPLPASPLPRRHEDRLWDSPPTSREACSGAEINLDLDRHPGRWRRSPTSTTRRSISPPSGRVPSFRATRFHLSVADSDSCSVRLQRAVPEGPARHPQERQFLISHCQLRPLVLSLLIDAELKSLFSFVVCVRLGGRSVWSSTPSSQGPCLWSCKHHC